MTVAWELEVPVPALPSVISEQVTCPQLELLIGKSSFIPFSSSITPPTSSCSGLSFCHSFHLINTQLICSKVVPGSNHLRHMLSSAVWGGCGFRIRAKAIPASSSHSQDCTWPLSGKSRSIQGFLWKPFHL